MQRKVEIVKYNFEWPKLYEQEKQNLLLILKNRINNIYHFGSTAIYGMSAKPIIDILHV